MSKSGLNMSRRIRRTPYTNKVEEFGVTGFTVVNHMLLPKAFKKNVEEEYRKQFINGNWKYLSGDKAATSYNAINTHDLIVFTNSIPKSGELYNESLSFLNSISKQNSKILVMAANDKS